VASPPLPGDQAGPELRPVSSLLRRPRLSPVPVLVALVVVLIGAGTAAAVVRSDTDSAAPARPASLAAPPAEEAAAPVTTSTTVVPPPPAPAPRTTPTPPPPERVPTPLVKVGEIHIPKIGLVHPMYEGVTLTVVDHGPGHWPGSAMPGQLGNAVIAGHRVTHSHPFRHLDKLVPGDEIIFRTEAGEFTYRVTGQQIVGSRDTWIVNPTPDATVTLFACHPPGSARQRIVVRGVYTGSSPAV
jgi:sortase A